MAGPFEFLNKPEVLRELRGVIADAFGFALALFGARRLKARHVAREKRRHDGAEAEPLAISFGRPDDPTVTHCIYCSRSVGDVETLGCGGANRKGICPRSQA